jgi:hypothetical protein
MIAKDKARELFNKYWSLLMIHEVKNRRLFTKQCALICVDEVLKNIPKEVMSYNPFMMNTDYWQEVRQEINKM